MESESLPRLEESGAAIDAVRITLTDEEKTEYLRSLRSQLVKLLTLIEEERAGGYCAESYFGKLLFDVGAADWLFEDRLVNVVVKLSGLYRDRAYATMPMKDVKGKIFESRGIVDGLMREYGHSSAPRRRKAE